jgi:hypothetical protein
VGKVQDFLANQGCDWKFIPPHMPHFCGLWEAALKSKTYHLRGALGSRVVTYEELSTLLEEIEACLNSRHICVFSNDPQDPSSLSPGHFLLGDMLTNVPSTDMTNMKCLSRWQEFQQQLQPFWQPWSADYLTQLQQRHNWQTQTPNLTPGTIMLLKEDNVPTLQWSLAVIQDVHPGPDSNMQVATVKISKGLFKRPSTKLILLPFPCDL